MKTDDKQVVLTAQIQADLRLAWKQLEDAGYNAAADRLFALLEQRAASPAARYDGR